MIESKEDKSIKETALEKITEIVNSWMGRVGQGSAKVLCFGSYKLGVSSPKGDVDAIILCPVHVD